MQSIAFQKLSSSFAMGIAQLGFEDPESPCRIGKPGVANSV
jgi:hypothetical protein